MALDTATLTAPDAGSDGGRGHSPLFRFLFVHSVDEYPTSGRRTGYLALAVIATIALYYTYYTQTGVTPNILQYYHMSFSFYVGIVIVANIIGAFASLPASKTDKLGRANVIIYGLLIVGLIIAVGVPSATTEWEFATFICLMGLVEGAILVATPAMVRDFSPQVGRASAMGFWTVGPVAGSLVTSIVANHTLDHFLSHNPQAGWKSQFVISGITSIVLFVVCLVLMKDLSSKLRDQLMVSAQDRALVEARARGLTDEQVLAATANPWRQIFTWDLVLAAVGIAVFLLIYYAASSFFTIFYSTVFKDPSGLHYTVSQANGLNTWFWSANIIALIIVGVVSDLLKVRKPFLLVGAVGSLVSLIVFLGKAGDASTGYDTVVVIEVVLAVFLAFVFAPWMAGYTEMVEAKNPALVGTGLALWGWVLRLVVGISFIFLPVVINSVNPVVDNLPVATPAIQTFIVEHADSVAFAQQHAAFLAVLNEPANKPVVAALTANPDAATISRAAAVLGPTTFGQIVKYQSQLTKLVVPYQNQLDYLSAHQSQLAQLQRGLDQSPRQWQHWFWVCVAGMVLFIPTIWLNRGRWSPKGAREDEERHDREVARELDELVRGAGAPA